MDKSVEQLSVRALERDPAMARKKSNSRALRHLAEELVGQIAEEERILEDARADLVTSLVRQWGTYDGHATLFLDKRQVYFHLVKTKLGGLRAVPEADVSDWIEHNMAEWDIAPEKMPELIEQLNRGQSAETTDQKGIPLRLWVNPKERNRGVEVLVELEAPAGVKRDNFKIAGNILKQQFRNIPAAQKMDEMARSVVRQWQQFEGHACLFVDDKQLMLTLTEQPKGGCSVRAAWIRNTIKQLLLTLGFSPNEIPDVLARINRGQEIAYKDKKGVPSLLWLDPKQGRMMSRPVDAPPSAPLSGTLPIFCPECSAVLKPWRAGTRQQRCPFCGCSIVVT